MEWQSLTQENQLYAIDAASQEYPIVIFKHSTTCSISTAALGRLERQWKPASAPALKAYYLDLLAYRPISNAIASRYGIQHQSPQILVISKGQCVYNTSHMDINFADVLDAVQGQAA